MIALVVAAKDLRQRLRDRSAYIVGIGAPLLLASLIGLALGGAEQEFHADMALADSDGGTLAQVFAQCVLGSEDLQDVIDVRTAPDAATARRWARDGDVDAAFVIPEGFSRAAMGSESLPMGVVGSAESPIGTDVAVAIARGFTAQVDAQRLTFIALADIRPGPSGPFAPDRDQSGSGIPAPGENGGIDCDAAGAAAVPVAIEEISATRADVSAVSQYAPAMGILFLFFTVGLGARSLIAERQGGTLARLLAAPVSGRVLLAGKAIASFVLGVASMTTLAIVSSLLIDARWGDWVSATALIVATVFAVMGIVGMLITFAKTEQQANGYASIAAFGLALLGGNFVDLSQAPALLRKLSLVTPNGWALRAFGDLAAEGGGISSIAPELGAILAFGAATFMVAIARAHRLVEP